MRYLILSFILIFAGCASAQSPGYISRVDHPYDQTFYAGFEKVVSCFMYVLKNQGWAISSEVDPSIYERDDRYDNNSSQNLLIITDARNGFLHLGRTHLNVFIHAINNTCDVEIRISPRKDQIAQRILGAVGQEISK